MKTPDPAKAESSVTRQGAQIIAAAGFPAKQNTVTSDVLARVLTWESLTSLDTVYEASTTCLGTVVFYLANNYEWLTQSIDKAIGWKDGCVAWVFEYFLPAEIIVCAMAVDAGEWCVKVRAARRVRRTHAAQARRDASRANAAGNSRSTHPAQWRLFDGLPNA